VSAIASTSRAPSATLLPGCGLDRRIRAVVPEEADPARAGVVHVRLVERTVARRPVAHEHRQAVGIAALVHLDRAAVGRRDPLHERVLPRG
jgi:hypothetical protein